MGDSDRKISLFSSLSFESFDVQYFGFVIIEKEHYHKKELHHWILLEAKFLAGCNVKNVRLSISVPFARAINSEDHTILFEHHVQKILNFKRLRNDHTVFAYISSAGSDSAVRWDVFRAANESTVEKIFRSIQTATKAAQKVLHNHAIAAVDTHQDSFEIHEVMYLGKLENAQRKLNTIGVDAAVSVLQLNDCSGAAAETASEKCRRFHTVTDSSSESAISTPKSPSVSASQNPPPFSNSSATVCQRSTSPVSLSALSSGSDTSSLPSSSSMRNVDSPPMIHNKISGRQSTNFSLPATMLFRIMPNTVSLICPDVKEVRFHWRLSEIASWCAGKESPTCFAMLVSADPSSDNQNQRLTPFDLHVFKSASNQLALDVVTSLRAAAHRAYQASDRCDFCPIQQFLRLCVLINERPVEQSLEIVLSKVRNLTENDQEIVLNELNQHVVSNSEDKLTSVMVSLRHLCLKRQTEHSHEDPVSVKAPFLNRTPITRFTLMEGNKASISRVIGGFFKKAKKQTPESPPLTHVSDSLPVPSMMRQRSHTAGDESHTKSIRNKLLNQYDWLKCRDLLDIHGATKPSTTRRRRYTEPSQVTEAKPVAKNGTNSNLAEALHLDNSPVKKTDDNSMTEIAERSANRLSTPSRPTALPIGPFRQRSSTIGECPSREVSRENSQPSPSPTGISEHDSLKDAKLSDEKSRARANSRKDILDMVDGVLLSNDVSDDVHPENHSPDKELSDDELSDDVLEDLPSADISTMEMSMHCRSIYATPQSSNSTPQSLSKSFGSSPRRSSYRFDMLRALDNDVANMNMKSNCQRRFSSPAGKNFLQRSISVPSPTEDVSHFTSNQSWLQKIEEERVALRSSETDSDTIPIEESVARRRWKEAYAQTILLIRLEKANRELQVGQSRSETKRLKLDYAEPQLDLSPDQLRQLHKALDVMLQAESQSSLQKISFIDISNILRQGVTKARHADCWKLIMKRHYALNPDRSPLPTGNQYHSLLSQRLVSQHTIMNDLNRTYPHMRYFQSQEGQISLFNLLKAYSLYDNELGYCQGMNFIAGILLAHLDEDEAFQALCFLMNERGLRDQYKEGMAQTQMQFYQLERLVHSHLPDLADHLTGFDPPITAAMYSPQWFLSNFAAHFSIGFVARVFDLIFLIGIEAIFRVGLLLLKFHEDRLLEFDAESVALFMVNSIHLEGGGITSLADSDIVDIFNEAFLLDISSQLRDFSVEYDVMRSEQEAEQTLVQQLYDRIESLRSEKDSLKEENNSATQKIISLEQTVQDLRVSFDTLKAEFDQQTERFSSERQKWQNEKKIMYSQIEALTRDRKDMGTTLQTLQSYVNALKQE